MLISARLRGGRMGSAIMCAGLVTHIQNALGAQFAADLGAAQDVGGDVVAGDHRHLPGRVTGLGKIDRCRSHLHRGKGDRNAGGIDFRMVLRAVVGVHRDDPLGIAEPRLSQLPPGFRPTGEGSTICFDRDDNVNLNLRYDFRPERQKPRSRRVGGGGSIRSRALSLLRPGTPQP